MIYENVANNFILFSINSINKNSVYVTTLIHIPALCTVSLVTLCFAYCFQRFVCCIVTETLSTQQAGPTRNAKRRSGGRLVVLWSGMRVQVSASAGVACVRRALQWGGGVRRGAAGGAGGGGCITESAFGGGEAVDHLALPVALQQARVERARRVDGVLAGQHRVGRAHWALAEPWQGDFPPALVLFSGGWRRGGPHRAADTCRRGVRSRRLRPSRRAALSPLPPPPPPRASLAPPAPSRTPGSSTHYAASVSSYISRIYSTKAHAAASCEGRV